MVFSSLYAQRLWEVLTGAYPPTLRTEIPLITSLFYYSLTIFIGRILRTVNRKITPQRAQLYVGDLITTFEVCANSLENAMMRRYYGWTGYCLALISLALWYSLTFKEYRANPCSNMLAYMRGSSTLVEMVVRSTAQLCGGLMSYNYARNFWSLELMEGHSERFHSLHCTSDLTVPFLIGFGIEFGGTFIDSMLSITTFTPYVFYETTSKIVFSVWMVVLGVDSTGMYLNPVNAANQNWGCHGTHAAEHISVYWVGPLVAAALAVVVQRHLVEAFRSARKQTYTEINDNTEKDLTNGIKQNGLEENKKEQNGLEENKKEEASPVQNGGDTYKGPTLRSRKTLKAQMS